MDWFLQLANEYPTLGSAWLIWVTLHDFAQWAIMLFFGLTIWGQRKKLIAEAVKAEVAHIHEELHNHIAEDIEMHGQLGQDRGLTKVK